MYAYPCVKDIGSAACSCCSIDKATGLNKMPLVFIFLIKHNIVTYSVNCCLFGSGLAYSTDTCL